MYRARALITMLDTSIVFINNCPGAYSNSSNAPVITLTDVNITGDTVECTLYPNPASDELIIEFSNEVTGLTFELFNLIGENVLSQKLDAVSEKYVISLNKVKAGVYLYNLTETNSVKGVGKLVIIK